MIEFEYDKIMGILEDIKKTISSIVVLTKLKD